MRARITVLAALGTLCCLAPLLLVRAQEPARNPHGDIKVDCSACHSAEAWAPLRKPLAFEHAQTGFALEGAHAQASCRSCHLTLAFSSVGVACADCHRDPHQGELGAQCEACHAPLSWSNQREMFRAHSRTRFPLLGAHASVACEGCHGGQRADQFAGTPTECGSCHLRDYEAARDPDHARLGFSRRCDDCHRIAAQSWRGSADFTHPASFPLRGAHAPLACDRCHRDSFSGTSAECVSCHRDDFQRANRPSHRGFPTACQDCHTDQGWRPAQFDHDRFFPIDSGPHRGTWSSCSTCHVSASNFAIFECTRCHEHNREEMDDEHDEVAGYEFRSAACYRCHPRGTE